MRQTKFRAWDTKEKKMVTDGVYHVGSLGSESLAVDFRGNVFSVGEDICGNAYTGSIPEGRFILMQFTGLHDADGVDIYEGDVVRYGDGRVRAITWNEDQASFSQDGRYSRNRYRWSFTCDDAFLCEVIGNIYANPELLEAPHD